jgi:hypothetical protein
MKRRDPFLTLSIVGGRVHKHTDPPHLLGLLRAHSNRPCGRRSAEKSNEIAPSHCLPPRLQKEHRTGST